MRSLLIGAVISLLLAGYAAASAGKPSAAWLAQAQCIHRHEGPWSANTGNGYFGGMQFAAATWTAMKGPKDPAFTHPGIEKVVGDVQVLESHGDSLVDTITPQPLGVMTWEEARDVAQETFARIWADRVNLREPRAVTAWVYRTSTNLAIDRYRDPWRKERAEAPDWEQLRAASADPEARAHWRRLLAHLRRAVPRRELEVAILSRLDGLTHEEIAEVTGAGERTVRRLSSSREGRMARASPAARPESTRPGATRGER